jgi:hypothetical protein
MGFLKIIDLYRVYSALVYRYTPERERERERERDSLLAVAQPRDTRARFGTILLLVQLLSTTSV